MKVLVQGVIKKVCSELEGRPGVFINKKRGVTRIIYPINVSASKLEKEGQAELLPVEAGFGYQPDFYQVVIVLKENIDGRWKVVFREKEVRPFLEKKDTGVYKYAVGVGATRVIRQKGRRVTEELLALFVKSHRPVLVRKTILEAEIGQGLDEETIRQVFPDASNEALDLVLNREQKEEDKKVKKNASLPNPFQKPLEKLTKATS